MNTFDDLFAFASWWMATKSLRPPLDNIHEDENYSGVVLYRDGQYQVELFTIKKEAVGVPHIHPNVDSYECYVSGEIDFVISGQLYSTKEGDVGQLTRIHPWDWHTGDSKKGGSFLSLQKWLNGVSPTSVTLDWTDKNGNKKVNWN